MNYTINITKRNNIILSSSFLILYFLIRGVSFLFIDSSKLDTIQNGFIRILYIIAYSYLLLVFLEYFKHYKLKVLQNTTLIIMTVEIAKQLFKLIKTDISILPQLVSFISIIATIIWIVFVFQLETLDYKAVKSLRKYAIGIIASCVIGYIIFLITSFNKLDNCTNSMNIAFAIPYIFTIDFAMKLHLKE